MKKQDMPYPTGARIVTRSQARAALKDAGFSAGDVNGILHRLDSAPAMTLAHLIRAAVSFQVEAATVVVAPGIRCKY